MCLANSTKVSSTCQAWPASGQQMLLHDEHSLHACATQRTGRQPICIHIVERDLACIPAAPDGAPGCKSSRLRSGSGYLQSVLLHGKASQAVTLLCSRPAASSPVLPGTPAAVIIYWMVCLLESALRLVCQHPQMRGCNCLGADI